MEDNLLLVCAIWAILVIIVLKVPTLDFFILIDSTGGGPVPTGSTLTNITSTSINVTFSNPTNRANQTGEFNCSLILKDISGLGSGK